MQQTHWTHAQEIEGPWKARNRTAVAEMEYIHPDLDLAEAVKLCMDAEANMIAAAHAARLAKQKMIKTWWAVYVIGPVAHPEINKVGFSNDPVGRLCNLQIGNWHRLEIRGLVWPTGRKHTEEIEALVHRAAKEMEIDLGGEWIEAEPAEAVELIIKAARYARYAVEDSAAHIRNFASSTEAIARIKNLIDSP